jgi:acetyl-CoA carboxylase biotin carboxylase subunit
MLKKCLIANRGEIAVRIIHACRELGITSVAVYSEADKRATHVQMADEAHFIGEAPPTQSYLNVGKLIAIAKQAGCDCVHPGYGFLSERAYFAQAVLEAGLVWVGPPPRAIELMGVKTTARALMEAANVPVIKGYQAENASLDDLIAQAEGVGFPLMVKAAGGGGGKGIRIVRQVSELREALLGAQSEAQKAFGDQRVFLERYIENGRHIEVQVLADAHGNTVHLYERECSVQRRHQKIIEESPSPNLTPEVRLAMGQAAVNAAHAVGYVNAGTVEFIVSETGEFFFLEMNTRLQVEHPVTELVTGVDLVHEQFHIANGSPLRFRQEDLSQRGHAIELRLYAEDPHNHFLPSTGKVLAFHAPMLPHVRVDSGLKSGDDVTIHYDPMIAKLIVDATTRDEAIQRALSALKQTSVLGVTTNLSFLRALLNSEAFQRGQITTSTLDKDLERFLPAPHPSLEPPLSTQDWLALLGAVLYDQQAKATSAQPSGDVWDANDGFRMV